MGKILEFPGDFQFDGLCYEALEKMPREGLETLLERLGEALHRLDNLEPDDEESEEFEAWADTHEEIEDWMDDIRDLLED